jgi:hypothetical protein
MRTNPKSEARNSKQKGNLKPEFPKPLGAAQVVSNFDLCALEFVSDFEIRISDFPRKLAV